MRIELGMVGLAALLLSACGHCGDSGPTAATESQGTEVPTQPSRQRTASENGEAKSTDAKASAENANGAKAEERECDRSIPWEERKQCWADKGIWPHAPAMTQAEWDALDIQNATLEQVQKLIPRAVTGDVCAALNNTAEQDPWKRWSPALPVELNVAILVAEGEDAQEKIFAWHMAQDPVGGSSGIAECDGKVLFWAAGSGDFVDPGAQEIEALGGLDVVYQHGFPPALSASQVILCTEGKLWRPRCQLLMRQVLRYTCPRQEHRSERWKRFCPEVREFFRDG